MLGPVTLWPFPSERVAAVAEHARGFLVVEMNAGQLVGARVLGSPIRLARLPR
jgi:pyruvate/2-oxoacid:ferredoxin oxidoreductase alpha subunit